MKQFIRICAACKKQLHRRDVPAGGIDQASRLSPGETVYSHGICFACGVRLYGADLMAGSDNSIRREMPIDNK